MRAPVRLISKLKNQRELIKTADFGGESFGGPDKVGWGSGIGE
jgi:hypothetical protein